MGCTVYTDEQYVNGVRTGDRVIFTAMVRQYLDPMLRFSIKVTGSDDYAHDIVQNVFIRVWAKGKRWAPKSSVAAYLFTAVRNGSINQMSVERNRHKIEARIRGEAEDSTSESDSDVLLISDLNACLELLTDRQRQAIHLRYYQGLSVQEVAEVLNIDLRATRRLLSRSISSLQSIFSESGNSAI